jgi:hypothetical protein
MYWVLVISMFSPSGEFMKKYSEGPIKSAKECVARKTELNNQPDLFGVQFKVQCLKVKKEAGEYPI